MESSNEICILKWNNFESNITEKIHSLRGVDDFYDVTLVGDDLKQVTAHRLVLSASSEYFKKILQNNKGFNHPILCLQGLIHSDINNIMDFIYNGQLELPQDEVKRYLHLAKRLELFGIHEPIETDLNKETSDELLSEGSDEHSKEVEGDAEHDNSETIAEDTDVNKEFKKEPHSSGELNEDNPKTVNESFSKNTDGSFSCNVCPRTTQMRHHMKEHIETHISGLSYQCKNCDKIFRTNGSLRQHRYRSHRVKGKKQKKQNLSSPSLQ